MSGERMALRVGNVRVGRSPENEIHLDDPQISRHHVEITWDGTQCMITDLSSRNGTFVNGRRLMPNMPELLRPGDRVSFGTTSVWTVMAG
jgi:pSer/pThr/pTyr-binding forkhead associated (FHA) protein